MPLFLLSPDLSAHQIIKSSSDILFCVKIVTRNKDFYAEEYKVELWTNLSATFEWISCAFIYFPLEQQHKLVIFTTHLPSHDYEYTLRYRKITDNHWTWLGIPDNNGHIHILPRAAIEKPYEPFTQHPSLECSVTEYSNVHLSHIKTQSNEPNLITIHCSPNPSQYVTALVPKGSCWLTPLPTQLQNNSQKWQLCTYQDNMGHFHLWIVVGQSSWLLPGPHTLTYHFTQDVRSHLVILSSTHFSLLFPTALHYIFNHIIHSVSANRQLPPSFLLHKLGYCTWNALGRTLDEDNLLQLVNALPFPIGYVILDDGWQSVIENQMESYEASLPKFPLGLKHTVSLLKSTNPTLHVGVWHTLWGYWNGIHPSLGTQYGYKPVTDINHATIGLIDHPREFYHHFYQYLHEAGIDFVKVDNQGAFEDILIQNKSEVGSEYRQAMMDQADTYFNGNIIHCMSFTPSILFNPVLSLHTTSIFRNSDDYFPDEEDSHTWHIYTNAINSLLLSQYPVVPDWDMFQSLHSFAEYHATSRALSGGPIYLTDKLGCHDIQLVKRLIALTREDGYCILRYNQSPKITMDTLFGNPMERSSLTSFYNWHEERSSMNATYITIGFWNTGPNIKLGLISNRIVEVYFPMIAYVLTGPEQGRLLIHMNSSLSNPYSFFAGVLVSDYGSSLVCLCPIRSIHSLSVACLGLIHKYNSVIPIVETSLIVKEDNIVYEAHLSHRSSSCAFWISSNTISRVLLDQQVIEYIWSADTHILNVNMMNTTSSNNKGDYVIQIEFYLYYD